METLSNTETAHRFLKN